uniref:Prolyl endopeptidase n=1 Tax=Glycine max TaxID=3847 RepID=K7LM15_SOYBN
MEMFGDVRIGNYYWLRDDSRTDPEVLSYLHEENAYTDSIMSGRIKEEDVSAPLRKGPCYYYKRTLEGKEYVQYCRRLISDNQKVPYVHDIMPTGPEAPPEHVILDVNVKAQHHQYCTNTTHTPKTPKEMKYILYVIDAETQATIGEPLVGVTSYFEWAGDNALVYVMMDEILRPDKAWFHVLGTEQSKDTCLYVEKDDMFSLDLEAFESKKYLFVASESKNTRFNFYLDVSKLEEGLKVLTPSVDGIDTTVSHIGACAVNNTSSTTVLIPHRESVKIQEIQLFSDHLVVYERENGLPKIIVYHLPPISEPLRSLESGQAVSFVDPVYSAESSGSEFPSSILGFLYSSLRTPSSVYDDNMKAGISVLKKIDSSNWSTMLRTKLPNDCEIRIKVTKLTYPGAKRLLGSGHYLIPILIVYRKDLVKLDGSDPLLLYGYGLYELISGGGEMGRQWYENGKLLKKKNTFTDFIACAEYLIEKNSVLRKDCIEGRSAGGLLIGAVLNMRPDLCKAAVAGVPFVDVVTTMLDPTIPLTTSEWEEWDDPRKEEFYFYMKSYSPVDNAKAQNYPNILVTEGLNDTRVLYSEPAKFVAKLRKSKIDDNILLFKCEFGAGHSSKSER